MTDTPASEPEAGTDCLQIDNMYLCGSKLTRVNLSQLSVSDTVMQEARFDDVNMGSMVARNVNLSDTKISNANLTGTSISEARLTGMRFSDVDMSAVQITNADLSGARIDDANLCGVAIGDANLDGMTIRGIPVIDMIAAYEAAQKV